MILAGTRLSPEPVACGGLLVIGDPHVSSRRPGRRTDPDWPGPVLAKLERCVAIANERDLWPIILGDLFEHPVERDLSVKSRLIRVLQGFRRRPLVNVGNHDMAHSRLGDGDSLAMLALCDVVDAVPEAGPVAEAVIGGRRLGLGMTPYGQAIPEDVTGAFAQADETVWFTHHDLAFERAYPGAVAPPAIAGCRLAVNGHVHKRHRPVTAGGTRWLNPGNITRQSVDLADHAPAAWIIDAGLEAAPEALPHATGVFDLTGRLVAPAADAALAASVESAFVSLLSAEDAAGLARSDDGSIIAEAIAAKFADDGTPEPIQAIVRSLLAEAVERRARER